MGWYLSSKVVPITNVFVLHDFSKLPPLSLTQGAAFLMAVQQLVACNFNTGMAAMVDRSSH